MNIGVTGASGRIGNLLVRRLIESGHTVSILSRRNPDSLAGLPLHRVQGDILDQHTLDHWVQGCEVVYHLAAIISVQGDRSGKVQEINVEGTRRVLEACRRHGVRRVICFSSVHAFNQHPQNEPLDETRPLAFHSKMAYDRSKAESLALAMHFAIEKKPEVVALCPTSVIGPYDFEPSLSGRMLLDFYHRKIPVLVPGGFDWVDVRDVVDAGLAALERGRNGEAYLLSGTYVTVAELARRVGDITGVATPALTVPNWLLRASLPAVGLYAAITSRPPLYTGEMLDTLQQGAIQVSSEKARRELGFSSRPLNDTIADAYDWFRANRYIRQNTNAL